MQNLNSKIVSQNLYQAFELMHQKEFDRAEGLMEKGLKDAEAQADDLLAGLYYSAYGILYKLKKEFRKAWKFYEKAEKLIPNDPALKIISARLLVDFFGQYDTVIKKMDKVQQMMVGNVPFTYQAITLQGVAYLRKGDKKNAIEALKKSMDQNFKGLETSANFDFKLVEELIKKKIELPLCRDYLEKALAFTKSTREKNAEKLIQKFLSLFPSP